MFPRPALAATASPLIAVVAIALAACTGAGSATSSPVATPHPTQVAIGPAVLPTPVPVPASTSAPSPSGGIGAVDEPAGVAVLSVEPLGGDAYRVTVEDPAARAWRISVAGTGEDAADSWQIKVLTSDVGPQIDATEIVGDKVVGTMDLTGMWDGTAAAGGCHSTLPVCLDSSGFKVPDAGDGTFSVVLHLTDASTPLTITAATAGWPGEPFILGPWSSTEPFPWGPPA